MYVLDERLPPNYALRMTILAANIAELLSRAKRQSDVADACGVSQPTVSRWATGSKPEPEALVALSGYAGVSTEMLVTVPIAEWPTPDRERFKAKRMRRGWSPAQLSQHAHVVIMRERAKASISVDMIAEFEGGGGSANPTWLRFAEMALQEGAPPEQASTEPRDDLVYLRRVDIAFAMGDGTEIDPHADTRLVPFNLNDLRALTKAPIEALILVDGIGDSMETTLSRHDTLLIDTSRTEIRQSDLIWAFDYGGGGMVKRLRRIPGDKIRITSDNSLAPPPEDVPASDIRIVGKVLLALRTVQ